MFLVWGLHFENHCHREWKSDPGESFPIGGIFLVCFVDWAVSGYFCCQRFKGKTGGIDRWNTGIFRAVLLFYMIL